MLLNAFGLAVSWFSLVRQGCWWHRSSEQWGSVVSHGKLSQFKKESPAHLASLEEWHRPILWMGHQHQGLHSFPKITLVSDRAWTEVQASLNSQPDSSNLHISSLWLRSIRPLGSQAMLCSGTQESLVLSSPGSLCWCVSLLLTSLWGEP